MKFEFPLVHGLDTPAMTWSKTETYDSYKHEYVRVLQKRILFLFLLRKGDLIRREGRAEASHQEAVEESWESVWPSVWSPALRGRGWGGGVGVKPGELKGSGLLRILPFSVFFFLLDPQCF